MYSIEIFANTSRLIKKYVIHEVSLFHFFFNLKKQLTTLKISATFTQKNLLPKIVFFVSFLQLRVDFLISFLFEFVRFQSLLKQHREAIPVYPEVPFAKSHFQPNF